MNKKIIIIVGPTGAGKTEVASVLAGLVHGEIISADSRQIYKYLDIGTNKAGVYEPVVGARLYNGAAQYLTDIIEPSEFFNAGRFVERANGLIEKIRTGGKVPIIAGGTGLYIKALVDGLAPLPESNVTTRQDLVKELENKGIEYMVNKLNKIDPEAAQKNKTNPQRLIRALEVFELTGHPITELQKQTKPSKENFLQVGLLWDKKDLNRNLDIRSQKMLASGMIEETKKALEAGFDEKSPGLQGIGYRDIIKYLSGKITKEEMQDFFKADMRHYAKRQMTWFNKDPRIKWIKTSSSSFNPSKIAATVAKLL